MLPSVPEKNGNSFQNDLKLSLDYYFCQLDDSTILSVLVPSLVLDGMNYFLVTECLKLQFLSKAKSPKALSMSAHSSEFACFETINGISYLRKKTFQEYVCSKLDFLFSSQNLQRDELLRSCIKSSTEGWVPISVIEKMNGIRHLPCNVREIILQAVELCRFVIVDKTKCFLRQKSTAEIIVARLV
jgi:hypothetical protein